MDIKNKKTGTVTAVFGREFQGKVGGYGEGTVAPRPVLDPGWRIQKVGGTEMEIRGRSEVVEKASEIIIRFYVKIRKYIHSFIFFDRCNAPTHTFDITYSRCMFLIRFVQLM